jgi:hypothetical protein
MNVERELVGLREAAAMFSVSEKTVRRRCADGVFPPLIKLGHRTLLPLAALRAASKILKTKGGR